MKDIILRYLNVHRKKKKDGSSHFEQEDRLYEYAKNKITQLERRKGGNRNHHLPMRHSSAPKRETLNDSKSPRRHESIPETSMQQHQEKKFGKTTRNLAGVDKQDSLF